MRTFSCVAMCHACSIGLRFRVTNHRHRQRPLLVAESAQEEEEEEEEEEEGSESFEMESSVNSREPWRFGKGWRLITTV